MGKNCSKQNFSIVTTLSQPAIDPFYFLLIIKLIHLSRNHLPLQPGDSKLAKWPYFSLPGKLPHSTYLATKNRGISR